MLGKDGDLTAFVESYSRLPKPTGACASFHHQADAELIPIVSLVLSRFQLFCPSQ
jgi:hypothetical protein